ncbi:MAG: dihydropyrimidinase, partial [Deltaproteobacteria bacterium]|nr:dihydropyrimidinase [Deltaproteobacteria bacterium]
MATLIKGDKIAAIGLGLDKMADEIVDARGMLLLPGGVDAHTHFSILFMGAKAPGFDTAKAAAVGGTTTIVDFVPQPAGKSLVQSLKLHRRN